MAHWKKLFPSKFLNATDLDTPLIATIKCVVEENVGLDDAAEIKPVVQWKEASVKPVVLNITRGEVLEELARSGDVNDWPGTRVLIRRGWTRFQGKRVACIEFAAPPAAAPDRGKAVEEPADSEVGF